MYLFEYIENIYFSFYRKMCNSLFVRHHVLFYSGYTLVFYMVSKNSCVYFKMVSFENCKINLNKFLKCMFSYLLFICGLHLVLMLPATMLIIIIHRLHMTGPRLPHNACKMPSQV